MSRIQTPKCNGTVSYIQGRPMIEKKNSQTPMRRRLLQLALAFLMTFSATGPLSAANDNNAKPYDAKLYRLTEILGAIHYLRELCTADDGMVWRKQMDDIIKSEGTNSYRRVTLIKQFNKGYRSYRRTYRTCTNSARTAIDHFLTEGTTISDDLIKKNW